MQRRPYRKRSSTSAGDLSPDYARGFSGAKDALAEYRATLEDLENTSLPPEVKDRAKRYLADLLDTELRSACAEAPTAAHEGSNETIAHASLVEELSDQDGAPEVGSAS